MTEYFYHYPRLPRRLLRLRDVPALTPMNPPSSERVRDLLSITRPLNSFKHKTPPPISNHSPLTIGQEDLIALHVLYCSASLQFKEQQPSARPPSSRVPKTMLPTSTVINFYWSFTLVKYHSRHARGACLCEYRGQHGPATEGQFR